MYIDSEVLIPRRLCHVAGLKPIDDEPSQAKDNVSKFTEMHNAKICHVKNMAALRLKPEKISWNTSKLENAAF